MAAAAAICVIPGSMSLAQEPSEFRRLDDIDGSSATLINAYLNAFAQLDGHEIAALALTLCGALLRGGHRHHAGAHPRSSR